MLFLLILQICPIFANNHCVHFGLQEIDAFEEKLGTTVDWDISFNKQFCIFEHEIYIIHKEKALPTCIGFHLDEHQICDATKVVCFGENEILDNLFSQNQYQLEIVGETNSFIHPDCPRNKHIIFYALPIESNSFVNLQQSENAETILETREAYEEISLTEEQPSNKESEEEERFYGYEVTLNLPTINIDAFEDPQNRILLMHCLQILISTDVNIMKYLGSQQSANGSGYVYLELNIDLKNELKLETNINLITNWLLNINKKMFKLENEDIDEEEAEIVNINSLTLEDNTTQQKNLNVDEEENFMETKILTTKTTLEKMRLKNSNRTNKRNTEEETLIPNIFLWLFVLVVITSIFCLSGVAFHVYIKYYAPGCEHKSVTSFQNLKEPDMTNVLPGLKPVYGIDYSHSAFAEKENGDDEIILDQHNFMFHGLNLPKKNTYHQKKQQNDFKVYIGIDSDDGKQEKNHNIFKNFSLKEYYPEENPYDGCYRSGAKEDKNHNYEIVCHHHQEKQTPGYKFVEYGHDEEEEASSVRKMMQSPHSTSSFGESVFTSSTAAGGEEVLIDFSDANAEDLFQAQIGSPREKRSSIYKFDREHPKLNELEGVIDYAPTPDGVVKKYIIGEDQKIESQSDVQKNEHGGGRYSVGQEQESDKKMYKGRIFSGQNPHYHGVQKFEPETEEERDGDFSKTCLEKKINIVEELVQISQFAVLPNCQIPYRQRI